MHLLLLCFSFAAAQTSYKAASATCGFNTVANNGAGQNYCNHQPYSASNFGTNSKTVIAGTACVAAPTWYCPGKFVKWVSCGSSSPYTLTFDVFSDSACATKINTVSYPTDGSVCFAAGCFFIDTVTVCGGSSTGVNTWLRPVYASVTPTTKTSADLGVTYYAADGTPKDDATTCAAKNPAPSGSTGGGGSTGVDTLAGGIGSLADLAAAAEKADREAKLALGLGLGLGLGIPIVLGLAFYYFNFFSKGVPVSAATCSAACKGAAAKLKSGATVKPGMNIMKAPEPAPPAAAAK